MKPYGTLRKGSMPWRKRCPCCRGVGFKGARARENKAAQNEMEASMADPEAEYEFRRSSVRHEDLSSRVNSKNDEPATDKDADTKP